MREAAVKRITDQAVLAKIANKADEWADVRQAAIKGLTGFQALAEAAARRKEARRLRAQGLNLREIAVKMGTTMRDVDHLIRDE